MAKDLLFQSTVVKNSELYEKFVPYTVTVYFYFNVLIICGKPVYFVRFMKFSLLRQ